MPRMSPTKPSPQMVSTPTMPSMMKNTTTTSTPPMQSHQLPSSPSMMNGGMAQSAAMTYIPPLCDGACGTTPRAQQQGMWTMLRQDAMEMLRMMPSLCWAMMTQRQHRGSWADMADMMMHMLLTGMEMCMMVACVPLYLMCPGMVFAVWMGCCAAMVMAMCWMLNGKEMMHQCVAGSEPGWMMGQENDDEKWMFMGGMGMSARHCHGTTLPMLSKLFSRPMTCICMPTYGLPFDMCMMMLQRCMPMPSSTRRTLYAQLRTALLDDATSRCVVLSHNHSAILLSQCVAMLCADIPADKLCKLELYTFGSAACEFMMPLGESNMEPEPHHHPEMQTAGAADRKCIHVEHFAMMNDPFARMGVLQGVRSSMESRYCGGVFIMNNDMMMQMMPESMPMPMMQMPMACSGLMMEDYMMAMFPAQMMMVMGSTAPSTASAMPRSVLDTVMHIDRDCAEKREIAAMSSYHSASRMKKGGSANSGSGKRLSWTGLATTAGHKNGISAGMVGLEMARKGCQNCAGHKGREVSWLSRYMGMMMAHGSMGMGIGMDAMKQAAMDGAAMARAP